MFSRWWKSSEEQASEDKEGEDSGVDDENVVNCGTPFLEAREEPEDEASSSQPQLRTTNDASIDPEMAISPKSVGILQEAQARAQHRARAHRLLIGSLAAVIFLLGCIVFLLYPRDAAFSIDSFEINENNSTFTDGDRLMTNWNAMVGITNDNFYPISIKEIKVTAFLEHDRRAPIGTGGGIDLRFPARSKSSGLVTFQMPVYAPSTGMPSLIGECMTQEKVDLFLQADIDLSWIHWSGHWIPMEFYATVDCKIPAVMAIQQRLL